MQINRQMGNVNRNSGGGNNGSMENITGGGERKSSLASGNGKLSSRESQKQ